MPVKIKQIIIRTVFFILCAAILIATPIVVTVKKSSASNKTSDFMMLTIWQVDCFEGGKGSRADYLQNLGNKFKEAGGCHIKVISLTPAAVLQNLDAGNAPDIISYGAGICGIDNLISGRGQTVWAHGGYCVLSVDENADFSDISVQNTVVNGGKDNFADAAALFCGIGGAKNETPTEAYVDLINGNYKYLLGTQRDIFRLKTRGLGFKVRPVDEFNDLFQIISVISENTDKVAYGKKYVEFLCKNSNQLTKIGMLGDIKLYDDELSALEGVEYGVKLTSPLSQSQKDEILAAIKNSDIKKLKNL